MGGEGEWGASRHMTGGLVSPTGREGGCGRRQNTAKCFVHCL